MISTCIKVLSYTARYKKVLRNQFFLALTVERDSLDERNGKTTISLTKFSSELKGYWLNFVNYFSGSLYTILNMEDFFITLEAIVSFINTKNHRSINAHL